MSLHSDLLDQSHTLLSLEPRKPRQASLRRAVSTAYYALFHLLSEEATGMILGNAQIRLLVRRTLGHVDMNNVSRAFTGGRLSEVFGQANFNITIPDPLNNVAQTFVDLQQARHEADYDLSRSFTRSEATFLVERVKKAFEDWKDIRQEESAKVYLTALIFGKRLKRN